MGFKEYFGVPDPPPKKKRGRKAKPGKTHLVQFSHRDALFQLRLQSAAARANLSVADFVRRVVVSFVNRRSFVPKAPEIDPKTGMMAPAPWRSSDEKMAVIAMHQAEQEAIDRVRAEHRRLKTEAETEIRKARQAASETSAQQRRQVEEYRKANPEVEIATNTRRKRVEVVEAIVPLYRESEEPEADSAAEAEPAAGETWDEEDN